MKNTKTNPARHKLSVLHQLSKLIPADIVRRAAKDSGVDKQARAFTPWSHLLTMLYAQLTKAISLWDIEAMLRHHRSKFNLIRGAHCPAHNTLSNANMKRPADMIEKVFWATLKRAQQADPSFKHARPYTRLPPRFKRAISAIDSSTIKLVANCMDWASHRRQKAAAKLHLRLSLNSFLPTFVVIQSARSHDNVTARELCTGLQAGEIVVADRAYNDFGHLYDLDQRGVFWTVRSKANLRFHVCSRRLKTAKGSVLRDDMITLKGPRVRKAYPQQLRRVVAEVEVKERKVVMSFLTNNMNWSAQSIAELYQARWGIEVFFKEIKQTLKLSSFLGYSENAIRWQVWSALLLMLVLRLQGHMGNWAFSFRKLYALVRGVVWDRYNLADLVESCGTASADPPPKQEEIQLEFILKFKGKPI